MDVAGRPASATPLLTTAPAASSSYASNLSGISDHNLPAVLHLSPRRAKCTDAPWILPFLAVLAFVLVYGLRGARLASSPGSFCNLIGADALDASATPSPSTSIYSECIHYIVIGSLADARSHCLVFAVNTIVGNSSDVSQRDSATSALQSAFTLCTALIASHAPNAESLCLQYGVSTFVGASTSSAALTNIFSGCLQPLLTNSSDAVNACADTTINTLIFVSGNTTSSVLSLSIFSTCLESSGGNVGATEECITSALNARNITTNAIDSFFPSCIVPAISSQNVSVVKDCVSLSLATLLPSSLSLVSDAVSSCITPYTNGSTDALGVASKCLEFGLTKALGGSSEEIFNIIEEAAVSILGGNIGKTFSQSCLAQTIGDLSAGKSFGLQNCLIQGVAQEFCQDVLNAGSASIANGLSTYFNSFRDRVAQNAPHLSITFVLIVAAGVAMAVIWMSVLIAFGEGLIWFSIFATLLNLMILMIINFIILNIPVAVILLIYFVFKIGFYVFIWKRIRFISILLRATVSHLRRNPGAFILATFLFLWNAGWCFLFACAYLELYSPNALPNTTLVSIAIVVLVLGFFWAFEVWKGILGVSVAGSLGAWFYFGGSEDTLNIEVRRKSAIISSFLHAITFSFGSICISSLLLAILKTAHYFYKKAKNSRSIWVKTLVNAVFGFMDYLLKTFDLYALNLIQEQGLDAVINDDCIETVTSSTSLLGSITLGSIAFITSKLVFKLDWDITLLCVFVALLFGYAMLSIMGVTVEMGVVSLFVCLAEDGDVLLRRHPRECKDLVDALIERCRERGWRVPGEVVHLREKMGMDTMSQYAEIK
ncbi:putative choline transporter, neither null mutation nor overexpression affects choline transport [Entophlyctis sp. JEL0112]|nr:putative choline transporter, neither null mutation nor overexpression affects choline transport [Entophlyctis sp. JEL0112]